VIPASAEGEPTLPGALGNPVDDPDEDALEEEESEEEFVAV
jgi:hypothetical protein